MFEVTQLWSDRVRMWTQESRAHSILEILLLMHSERSCFGSKWCHVKVLFILPLCSDSHLDQCQNKQTKSLTKACHDRNSKAGNLQTPPNTDRDRSHTFTWHGGPGRSELMQGSHPGASVGLESFRVRRTIVALERDACLEEEALCSQKLFNHLP